VSVSRCVASLCDDVSGGPVDFVVGDARLDVIEGLLLGLSHDLVNLPHASGRFAKTNGAGHVGSVSLEGDTEINEEKVTFLKGRRVRKMMDLPGIGTSGDDGEKGEAIELVPMGNLGENETLNGSFGHADFDEWKDGGEHLFVEFLGPAESFDFRFRFDLAHLIDCRGGDE
jgi:hypothetical protein